MKFRNATNADLPIIKKIVKKGLHEFGFDYQNETSEADIQDLVSNYDYKNGRFVLCTDNENKVVATGAFLEIEKGIFKIRKIYVPKVFRGNGYGKAMITYIMGEIKNSGGISMVLETSTRMNIARSLYEKLGFELEYDKTASPRCDIKMKKNIS